MKTSFVILFVAVFLVIGVVLGLQLSGVFKPEPSGEIEYRKVETFSTGENKIEIALVAVSSEDEGKYAKLVTEIREGEGLVLVNINNVLADYDTQYSARVAAMVASNYTGIDLDNKNII